MSSQLSDSSGYFLSPYEIEVSGNEIKALTIAFDTINNRHPYSIKIDGEEYVDDDAIFTINLQSANSHKISIDNWNAPSYPLVIMGIYVDITIEVDYAKLISLDRSIFDRSDTELPSYGIISNSGSLSFNDLNGEIKDYAEQMLLTSDLKVVISLNNTLAKTEQKVGTFETRDWDYDNDNRSVSVSLSDDLEEWQDIQIEGFGYDQRQPYKVLGRGSMADLYDWLHKRTPSKYDMLSYEELDESTKEILYNTTIQYPVLKSGSLWQQWTKLCEVCALYIYKNNDNKTVCSYTYGS
jgi:hypothetical protein